MPKPEFLTKAEAAEALGVSTRAIERFVTVGQLTPMYRRGSHGREAVYKSADVQALKAERDAPPRAETVSPSTALVRRAPTTPAIVAARRIAAENGPPSLAELALQTVVTVSDAGRLTGLGVGTIERAIEAGQLVAQPIGPRGSRVVLRSAVERLAEELLSSRPQSRARPKGSQR